MKKLLVILGALILSSCFRDIEKKYIERFVEEDFKKIPVSQMRDSLEVYDSLNTELDRIVKKYTIPNRGYDEDDLKKTAMGTTDSIPKINKFRGGIYFMKNYWNGPEREN